VAGSLTTLAWLPQLLKAFRTRSTKDFAWSWFAMFGVGGLLTWLIYGLMAAAPAVIAANAITLLLGPRPRRPEGEPLAAVALRRDIRTRACYRDHVCDVDLGAARGRRAAPGLAGGSGGRRRVIPGDFDHGDDRGLRVSGTVPVADAGAAISLVITRR